MNSFQELCSNQESSKTFQKIRIHQFSHYSDKERSSDTRLNSWEKLGKHQDSVLSIAYSPCGEYLASGSKNGEIKLWNFQKKQEECTLSGHHLSIETLQFSPEGTFLASGSRDRTMRLWNFCLRQEYACLNHESSVISISYSPNSKYLARSCGTRQIKIWNNIKQTEDFTFINSESVCHVSFSFDNNQLACNTYESIIIWNLELKIPEKSLKLSSGTYSFCFSPDPDIAATGSFKIIVLWNLNIEKEKFRVGHTEMNIYCLQFTTDGKFLMSGSDYCVTFWDLLLRKEIFICFYNLISSSCLSPDGQYIAISSRSRNVQVIKITEKKGILLKGSAKVITCLTFSNDGIKFAKGNREGELTIWNLKKNSKIFEICFNYPIMFIVFTNDNKCLLVGSEISGIINVITMAERIVKYSINIGQNLCNSLSISPNNVHLGIGAVGKFIVWNLSENHEEFTFNLEQSQRVRSLCFHPEEDLLALSSDYHPIEIWKYNEKRLHSNINDAVLSRNFCICFTPCGKFLVSASDISLIFWNFRTRIKEFEINHLNFCYYETLSFTKDGKFLALGSTSTIINCQSKRIEFELPRIEIYKNNTCFSPCGYLLAASTRDQDIIIWNFEKIRYEFNKMNNFIKISCFSRNKEYFAIVFKDTIKVYIMETNQFFYLNEEVQSINALCFSPNCNFLASGSDDSKIIIWNLNSKSKEFFLQGHLSSVLCLNFNSDGKLLASGSSDKEIKVWDVIKRQKIYSFIGHEYWVNIVLFSHNDSIIATGSLDQTVRIWSNTRNRNLIQTYYLSARSLAFVSTGRFCVVQSILNDGYIMKVIVN